MIKTINCLIMLSVLLFAGANAYAQKNTLSVPSGLMTDLAENTAYQSINGYPVKSSIANLTDKTVQSVLIGSLHPAFCWQMNDTGNDILQTAYQLLLADNKPFTNAWTSGKVRSNSSGGVVYTGPALKPNTAYYWKVRVFNNHGAVSNYSMPVVFYTAQVLKEHLPPAYPLQITDVKPVAFKQIDGIYRVDFGKDAFGTLRLTLNGESNQDSVIIRLGELTSADGSINQHPPATIRYARYAIKLAKGINTYKLQITNNKLNTSAASIKMPGYIGEVTPFRYAEIENYSGSLVSKSVVQLSVHYPFNDSGINFHSSDSTLNAVWELSKYSVKATSFTGFFIDGDRERIPYEADAYIAQLGNYAVAKEYTMARTSSEYLIGHPTWPTEWILQSVLIAWNDYLYTGDIQSIKNYYDDLKAKSLIALEDSTGLISTKNGRMTKEVIASVHYTDYLRDIVDWPTKTETDGFVFKNYNAVVNAYYYKNLLTLKKMSAYLGEKEDADFFDKKATAFKAVYHKAFFDESRKVYVDGLGTDHASLHTNMFALAFGLVEPSDVKDVLAFIRSRGMACSVYGAQFLLDAVYDAGDGDMGLSLLTSKNDRSWYNMIRVGSTITLEAWDNKYKPNQDWNHVWGAAPANIISRKLMGIEPLAPGWAQFKIKPQIGSLSYAQIDVPTIKGTIHATYSQNKKQFGVDVKIPANATAQVLLPLKNNAKNEITLDSKVVPFVLKDGAALIDNVGSGKHHFKVTY